MATISGTYTAAALQAILDADDDISVVGTVTVTSGSVTLDRPAMNVHGAGALVSRLNIAGGIIAKRVASISDVRIGAHLWFKDDSTADCTITGAILDALRCGTGYNLRTPRGSFVPAYRIDASATTITNGAGVLEGCTFDGVVATGIEWSGSNNTFLNMDVDNAALLTCMNFVSLGGYGKSSTGNRFRYCHFISDGGEELVGTDCLGNSDTMEVAILTVSGIGADSLTLTEDSDYAGWLDQNLVGKHVVLVEDSRYYRIESVVGSTYTLDLTDFDLDGVSIGDKVVVANFFVGNEWRDCTFDGTSRYTNAYGSYPTGVSLWGMAFGNVVRDCSFANVACGVRDGAFNAYCEAPGGDPTVRWRYHPSGRNRVYDCDFGDTPLPIHGYTATAEWVDWDTGEHYLGPASAATLLLPVRASEYVDNTWTTGESHLSDCHDVGVDGNSEVMAETFVGASIETLGYEDGDPTYVTYQSPFTPYGFPDAFDFALALYDRSKGTAGSTSGATGAATVRPNDRASGEAGSTSGATGRALVHLEDADFDAFDFLLALYDAVITSAPPYTLSLRGSRITDLALDVRDTSPTLRLRHEDDPCVLRLEGY